MTFLDLLAEQKTTVYSLSINSGVPKTTLTDIASGKADILECSGKTLLAISKSLHISIEELLSLEREEAKTLLPGFLLDSISEYRKAIRKGSTLIDCYSDQLNSSINVAEVEHLISKEQANRLRARYFKWTKMIDFTNLPTRKKLTVVQMETNCATNWFTKNKYAHW